MWNLIKTQYYDLELDSLGTSAALYGSSCDILTIYSPVFLRLRTAEKKVFCLKRFIMHEQVGRLAVGRVYDFN